jgi:hypothetical protein
MAIRNANFVDVPAIVRLLQEAYDRSHYAKEQIGDIDLKEAKRLVVQCIQRHGHKTGGGCWVQVAETDGVITGLLMGTLARVYVIGNKLMATDLFWLTHPMADPRDAANLMRSFMAWARSCPDVVEIKCGTTAVIGSPEEAGVILQRLGLHEYGRIYRAAIREMEE